MGNGKVAVVTGASSGMGKKLAKLCAKDGYDLSSPPTSLQ